jgi:hypothetical protein
MYKFVCIENEEKSEAKKKEIVWKRERKNISK